MNIKRMLIVAATLGTVGAPSAFWILHVSGGTRAAYINIVAVSGAFVMGFRHGDASYRKRISLK